MLVKWNGLSIEVDVAPTIEAGRWEPAEGGAVTVCEVWCDNRPEYEAYCEEEDLSLSSPYETVVEDNRDAIDILAHAAQTKDEAFRGFEG